MILDYKKFKHFLKKIGLLYKRDKFQSYINKCSNFKSGFLLKLLFLCCIEIQSFFFPIFVWMFGLVMDMHWFNWRLHCQTYLALNQNILFSLFGLDSFCFAVLAATASTSFHFCCVNFSVDLFCCMFCWFRFTSHRL